jgi:hypothetical protein
MKIESCEVRSPHGAKRNAGGSAPDFAALHPGYDFSAKFRAYSAIVSSAAVIKPIVGFLAQ